MNVQLINCTTDMTFHFYQIQCECVNDFPPEGVANIFLRKKSTSQTGLVVYKIHQPGGKIHQLLASE